VNALLSIRNLPDGSIVWSTHEPCLNCVKISVASRVNIMVYLHPKLDNFQKVFLDECGGLIHVVRYGSEAFTKVAQEYQL
jgi:deoxycytidylate deaminase